jgi:hypothetical protein
VVSSYWSVRIAGPAYHLSIGNLHIFGKHFANRKNLLELAIFNVSYENIKKLENLSKFNESFHSVFLIELLLLFPLDTIRLNFYVFESSQIIQLQNVNQRGSLNSANESVISLTAPIVIVVLSLGVNYESPFSPTVLIMNHHSLQRWLWINSLSNSADFESAFTPTVLLMKQHSLQQCWLWINSLSNTADFESAFTPTVLLMKQHSLQQCWLRNIILSVSIKSELVVFLTPLPVNQQSLWRTDSAYEKNKF